jgi:hypothetical protein
MNQACSAVSCSLREPPSAALALSRQYSRPLLGATGCKIYRTDYRTERHSVDIFHPVGLEARECRRYRDRVPQ